MACRSSATASSATALPWLRAKTAACRKCECSRLLPSTRARVAAKRASEASSASMAEKRASEARELEAFVEREVYADESVSLQAAHGSEEEESE